MTYPDLWPGTTIPRSTDNDFAWNTGEPSIFRPLQTQAALRSASTAKVAHARANGTDRSTLHGISKKADLILSTRRKYSAMVEGSEAGQKAADRRDAIRRGSI